MILLIRNCWHFLFDILCLGDFVHLMVHWNSMESGYPSVCVSFFILKTLVDAGAWKIILSCGPSINTEKRKTLYIWTGILLSIHMYQLSSSRNSKWNLVDLFSFLYVFMIEVFVSCTLSVEKKSVKSD